MQEKFYQTRFRGKKSNPDPCRQLFPAKHICILLQNGFFIKLLFLRKINPLLHAEEFF